MYEFVVSGVTNGFGIGYNGPNISISCRNMASANENPELVQDYLATEIALGRIKGPYHEAPFPVFRCNPIGIVPKKTPGKYRTIMNLSAPTGASVNDFIEKDDYSLSYVTIDKAVDYIIDLGTGCMLNKVDIADAFRILPVTPSQWHLLGIHWDGHFYFDTRLTMGGRSSPYIFDTFSSALEWICTHNYELSHLCHLLDDFFSAETVENKGNSLSVILNVFSRLGVPVAPGKVEGPVTCLEFLGITLDTIAMEARLSNEKISLLKERLAYFISRQKVSKREILSLVGSLSFACKVVVPGRRFFVADDFPKLHCSGAKFQDLLEQEREGRHAYVDNISGIVEREEFFSVQRDLRCDRLGFLHRCS